MSTFLRLTKCVNLKVLIENIICLQISILPNIFTVIFRRQGSLNSSVTQSEELPAFILLTPAIGGHVAVADLISQPLEVLGQVGILVSIGDDFDSLVQHVVAQLLELAHVLAPHQHEVLQVRLVLDCLQKQSLEGGVVHCAPAAEKHKGFGLVQFLDLTLLKQEVMCSL